jgi:uncharacterized protein (TIGR03435 family)
MKRFLPLILAFTLSCFQAPARSQPAPQPAFEAASIRLIDPDAPEPETPPQRPSFPTNRLTMRHAALVPIICLAYGVDYTRVLGGPDRIDPQTYDLDAKVEGDALLAREQMQPLLQNLLQERFHLVVHREQKIVPGYVLVVAKGGSKLQPNKGAASHGMVGDNQIKFWNESVSAFAVVIANQVGRPVVDQTGLTGTYDIALKLALEDDLNSNLPDLFTALQEQLGLKLVPEKVPVEFLIIDHVDKIPTKN